MSSKEKIRVFPDYASSGIWRWNKDSSTGAGGANMNESSISDVVSPLLMITLKYWHWVWALNSELWNSNKNSLYIKKSMVKFDEDGKTIVAAMNACQDKFEFIYIESF